MAWDMGGGGGDDGELWSSELPGARGWNGDQYPFQDFSDYLPPPPTGFRVTKTIGSGFKVQFIPYGSQARTGVAQWEIRYADLSAVGVGMSDANFTLRVQQASRLIGTVSSPEAGKLVTVTFNDPSIVNGYIIVLGVSHFGISGRPTKPWRLDNADGPPSGPGGDVMSAACVKTSTTNSFGDPIVILEMTYRAPTVQNFGGFAGVQPYLSGYETELLEIGGLIAYPFGDEPALKASGTVTLPKDSSPSNANIYFVSVGHDSTRRTDPTSAPSVNFPGGIV